MSSSSSGISLDAFDDIGPQRDVPSDGDLDMFDDVHIRKTPVSYAEIEEMEDSPEREILVEDLLSKSKSVSLSHRVNAKTKATAKGTRGYLENYYKKEKGFEVVGLRGSNNNFAILKDGQPYLALEDVDDAFTELGKDALDLLPEATEAAFTAAGAIKGAIYGAGATILGGPLTAAGGAALGGVGGAATGSVLGRTARLAASAALPGEDYPGDNKIVDTIGDVAGAGVTAAASEGAGQAALKVLGFGAKHFTSKGRVGEAIAKDADDALVMIDRADIQDIPIRAEQLTKNRKIAALAKAVRKAHPDKYLNKEIEQAIAIGKKIDKITKRIGPEEAKRLKESMGKVFELAGDMTGDAKVISTNNAAKTIKKILDEKSTGAEVISEIMGKLEGGASVRTFQSQLSLVGKISSGEVSAVSNLSKTGNKTVGRRMYAALMKDLEGTIATLGDSTKGGRAAKVLDSARKSWKGLHDQLEKRVALDKIIEKSYSGLGGEGARQAKRAGASQIDPLKFATNILHPGRAEKVAKAFGKGSPEHRALTEIADLFERFVIAKKAVPPGAEKGVADALTGTVPLAALGVSHTGDATGAMAGAASGPLKQLINKITYPESLAEILLDPKKIAQIIAVGRSTKLGKMDVAQKAASALMSKLAYSADEGDKEQ